VAHVLGIVRSQNVRVILQETHYPAQIAQLVAQRAGARLVALPSGTDIQRRESYIQHIERIVTALEKAFAGARAAAGTVPAAAMAHP
jgi:ABC-type Zn uptake system ZnuABC Zn-binding protein ZnuA